jgi:hypothetical protein
VVVVSGISRDLTRRVFDQISLRWHLRRIIFLIYNSYTKMNDIVDILRLYHLRSEGHYVRV